MMKYDDDSALSAEVRNALVRALPNYHALGYAPTPRDVVTDLTDAVVQLIRQARSDGSLEAAKVTMNSTPRVPPSLRPGARVKAVPHGE